MVEITKSDDIRFKFERKILFLGLYRGDQVIAWNILWFCWNLQKYCPTKWLLMGAVRVFKENWVLRFVSYLIKSLRRRVSKSKQRKLEFYFSEWPSATANVNIMFSLKKLTRKFFFSNFLSRNCSEKLSFSFSPEKLVTKVFSRCSQNFFQIFTRKIDYRKFVQ